MGRQGSLRFLVRRIGWTGFEDHGDRIQARLGQETTEIWGTMMETKTETVRLGIYEIRIHQGTRILGTWTRTTRTGTGYQVYAIQWIGIKDWVQRLVQENRGWGTRRVRKDDEHPGLEIGQIGVGNDPDPDPNRQVVGKGRSEQGLRSVNVIPRYRTGTDLIGLIPNRSVGRDW